MISREEAEMLLNLCAANAEELIAAREMQLYGNIREKVWELSRLGEPLPLSTLQFVWHPR
jgi:hypothetical protein